MATYYASQNGGATGAGTLVDPWSIADLDAGEWATVGTNTLYLLDEITTAINPGALSNGTLESPTVIRGDYSGMEATISVSGATTGFTTNSKDYVHFRDITVNHAGTGTAINITNSSPASKVFNCEVNAKTCIVLNNADDCFVYSNTVTMDGTLVGTGYGIRIIGEALRNRVYDNYITSTGVIEEILNSGINFLNVTTSIPQYNHIYRNTIQDISGNALIINNSDNNYFYSNKILGHSGDGLAIEGGQSNVISNNYVYKNKSLKTTWPIIKLGDNFGTHDPADNNIIINNIFIAWKTLTNRIGQFGGTTSVMGTNNTINNNIWYHIDETVNDDSFHINDGVTNTAWTFLEIQADGYEADGQFTNPEVNSSGIPDVYGPCYHAGKVLGFAAKDFKGHKFNNPPTIGAYEFTSRSAAKSGRSW